MSYTLEDVARLLDDAVAYLQRIAIALEKLVERNVSNA